MEKVCRNRPNREKLCGFVSGRAEIEAWEKSDLFQFCHDTTLIFGSLDAILQTVTEEDVKRAIKIGACNLYHSCTHNFVHEKSVDILKGLCKSAAFTLQAIVFLQSGVFERKQEKMIATLQPKDKRIREIRMCFKVQEQITPEEFVQYSDALLNWASG